jgi:hypothetical protein
LISLNKAENNQSFHHASIKFFPCAWRVQNPVQFFDTPVAQELFNRSMETVHLLKSPANAAHLAKSIEQ